MPKEIVHWLVAERTAALLRETSPKDVLTPGLADDLDTHPAALGLGAVFPDCLFYLIGPAPRELRGLAARLHGSQGEDTYELLRLQADKARSEQSNRPARAFWVGLASHVFADAVIHPFVYHHTGDYENNPHAPERHRLLETCMDLAVLDSAEDLKRFSLAGILDHPDADPRRLVYFSGLARLFGVPRSHLAPALHQSLTRFARLQALFRRRHAAALAQRLTPVLPQSLRNLAALFYTPKLRELAPLLHGELDYLHPVTGQALRDSLEGLMDKAARMTAKFCAGLDLELEPDGDPRSGIKGKGPSLGNGLPGVPAKAGTHYADKFILPL